MRPALEHHLNRDREEYVQKRDVVLGAPALLGIFGAVALVCALCFGYGYSSGHLRLGEGKPAPAAKVRPAPRPLGGASPSAQPDPVETESPVAGGEVQAMPPIPKTAATAPAPRRVAVAPPRENALSKPSAGVPVALTGQALVAGVPVPLTGQSVAARVAAPVPAPGANLMVQIAAVSRAQDAQTLAEALKHDGFAAMVRGASGDKLYHVQIGPFSSLDAAKNMRAKLVSNGYNAFIRP